MEPENQELLDIPSEKFTLIGDYKVYSQSGRYHGPCRLVHRNGDVIIGVFNEGQSEEVTCYKAYANYMKVKWRDNQLESEKGQIYNYRGKLHYKGEIKNGKRHGKGQQFEAGKLRFQGYWKNDQKNGFIVEYYQESNGLVTLEGNYTDGKKDGPFVLTYQDGTEITLNFQNGVLVQEKGQVPSTQPTYKDTYKYGCHMTFKELNLLRQTVFMIDTGVLSMFGQTIFRHFEQLSFTKGHDNTTIIFPVRFTEHFGGQSVNQSNYEPVQAICRHLTGNFSIVSGFYNKLYFPLMSSFHFTLGVVTVQNGTFTFEYFDSLHGSGYHKYNMVKRLLLQEYEHHHKKKQENILKAIKNMEYKKNLECARQYDGVSCGVFVCKYIYELTMLGRLRKSKLYIQNFRQFIADVLVSDQDKFQQLAGQEMQRHSQFQT